MMKIHRIFYNETNFSLYLQDQIRALLKKQFPRLIPDEIDQVFNLFKNPTRIGFNTMIFVAEDSQNNIHGVVIVLHEYTLNCFYLDYIAVLPGKGGSGIGGALYQRVREEARTFNVMGIFFDVSTDNPAHFPDVKKLTQNKKRLKFYEEFGVYPIINDAYSEPVNDKSPHSFLMFDGLGEKRTLSSQYMQVVVRVILEQRYGDVCPYQYVEKIVESFEIEPILLREPRYIKKREIVDAQEIIFQNLGVLPNQKIKIIMSDIQKSHHIPERGYLESPVRISAIWRELKKSRIFDPHIPHDYPEEILYTVHDKEFIDYFRIISKSIAPKKYIYPVTFPARNRSRPPKDLVDRVGYYCVDNSTPLIHNIFEIAKRAVDCAMTGAEFILNGKGMAYALVRPPGHHAEANLFGGFCYFNNTAIAAHFLSQHGRVAVIDLDYHHGNGTQQIFYQRSDVLTISLHGDPDLNYPYFSGFLDEIGEGEGIGMNVNVPLPNGIDGKRYISELKKVIPRIIQFAPQFLVIALGLYPAKKDPTGTWQLLESDFENNGYALGSLKIPTLVVQEGGYLITKLGKNALSFFIGLWKGYYT
ncbi:MAG: histone deacetylase family protein [Promethearchaeota archaeon]|nr:MAG: histone deacetylase family protein [Candidatus Lokiarchaeota archaeon]